MDTLMLIVSSLWFVFVVLYIYALIKTKTKPFELPDDVLFEIAFKRKEK